MCCKELLQWILLKNVCKHFRRQGYKKITESKPSCTLHFQKWGINSPCTWKLSGALDTSILLWPDGLYCNFDFPCIPIKSICKIVWLLFKEKLRQVGGFLQGHLVSFTNKTEILLKVALSTHNPNPYLKKYKLTPFYVLCNSQ